MLLNTRTVCLGVALAAIGTPALGGVAFEWATIGDPGNAPDPLTDFGAVDYECLMATTEVTNAPYAQFLNAVVASDPDGLWFSAMGGSFGGITRSGDDGSFTYSLVSGRENTAGVDAGINGVTGNVQPVASYAPHYWGLRDMGGSM
jgi:formylglycine-generating enzyme